MVRKDVRDIFVPFCIAERGRRTECCTVRMTKIRLLYHCSLDWAGDPSSSRRCEHVDHEDGLDNAVMADKLRLPYAPVIRNEFRTNIREYSALRRARFVFEFVTERKFDFELNSIRRILGEFLKFEFIEFSRNRSPIRNFRKFEFPCS
jgi:hypothetical protein